MPGVQVWMTALSADSGVYSEAILPMICMPVVRASGRFGGARTANLLPASGVEQTATMEDELKLRRGGGAGGHTAVDQRLGGDGARAAGKLSSALEELSKGDHRVENVPALYPMARVARAGNLLQAGACVP